MLEGAATWISRQKHTGLTLPVLMAGLFFSTQVLGDPQLGWELNLFNNFKEYFSIPYAVAGYLY